MPTLKWREILLRNELYVASGLQTPQPRSQKDNVLSLTAPFLRTWLPIRRDASGKDHEKTCRRGSRLSSQEETEQVFPLLTFFPLLSISSHLEEPAWDTRCPGLNLTSLRATSFIQPFHAVAQCLTHLGYRQFYCLHLCIFWNTAISELSP